jgi:hypothetical protein
MHITRFTLATAGIALLVAGCGGGNSPNTTAGGSNGPASGAQAAYRFSACMRSHGVPNFPDPVVHTSAGSQSVGIRVTPTETGSPAFKGAQKACQGIIGGPPNANPQQLAAQQHAHAEHLLAFARCMRTHGITSFPDPTAQGQIRPETLSAAGVDLHNPAVQKAAYECVPSSGGALTAAQLHQAFSGGH